MNPKDFQSLFTETENLNPTKIFNDLKALQSIKKLTDEEFTTVLNDFSISRLKYEGYLEKPGGYLWKVLSNYATRKWSKKSLETSFEKLDSFEAEINEEPSYDYKSTQQVLKEFFKAVQRLNLREKQLRLCKIMVDLSEEMHDSYFDFMQDVNNAAIASGMSYDDVRQTLSRFRKSMRGQDDIKGLLSFVPSEQKLIEFALEIVIDVNFFFVQFDGNHDWSLSDSLRGIYNEEYEILKDKIFDICSDPFDIKELTDYINLLLKINVIETDFGATIIDQADLKLLLRAILEELLNEGIVSNDNISNLFLILN